MATIKRCIFCNEEAKYNDKEMRIECTNPYCKAIVWFDFEVPNVKDEEDYIKRENIERWEKRTEGRNITSLLYDECQRASTRFMTSLYDIGKYGGLADALIKAKQLIREMQEELDKVELSEELLKALERLDRQ